MDEILWWGVGVVVALCLLVCVGEADEGCPRCGHMDALHDEVYGCIASDGGDLACGCGAPVLEELV